MIIKKSNIRIPKVRVTSEFDEDTRRAYLASVKEVGIIQKPIVRKVTHATGTQWYELIDGYNRIQPLKDDEMIEVEVMDVPDDKALLYNLTTALLKGKANKRQALDAIEKLATEGKMDLAQLSRITGIPRKKLEYIAEPLKWTKYMRDVIFHEQLQHRNVRIIAQAKCKDTQKDKITKLAIEDNWDTNQIKAALLHPKAVSKLPAKKFRAVDSALCACCGKSFPRKGLKFVYLCDKDLKTLKGDPNVHEQTPS